MHDEPSKPGEDPPKNPTNGTAEEPNTRAENLSRIGVVNTNAVIITVGRHEQFVASRDRREGWILCVM